MRYAWLVVGALVAGCAGAELEPEPAPVVCGDAVVGAGEPCDDGNGWAGDGCDRCAVETLPGEQEPNEPWDGAVAWGGAPVLGALPSGDEDCRLLTLTACDAVRARVSAPDGSCGGDLLLRLHAPDGALVATGGPGEDGCAAIDPLRSPGARMAVPGDWALCVAPLRANEVAGYALSAEVIRSSELAAPLLEADDLDGDLFEDRCDPDRDGDGVLDPADVCPEVADGPGSPPWQVSERGFVTDWLSIGPFTGTQSPSDCRPSLDALVGEPSPSPSLGALVAGRRWRVVSVREQVDFLPLYGDVEPSRESYLAAWVRSPAPRQAVLSVGADDGVRAWFRGQPMLDIASCQGVRRDQFQSNVSLTGGWDAVLLKVRDQGGGWGASLRFLDADEAPIVDLEVSLEPGGAWPPEQVDSDGDGLGDVCDPEP